MLYIISFILNKSVIEVLSIIRKIIIENTNILHTLLNGILLNYVSNTTEFLKIFDNIFSNKMFLENINYEFKYWNDFFMEISKYLGIIYIVLEEESSDNDTLMDLKINIPKNVNKISEYIYNNSNYKYSIIIKRNFKNREIYYPVCYLNYKDYYSSNEIYKKIFLYDDNIIYILKNILKGVLNSTINEKSELNLKESNNLQNKKNPLNFNILETYIHESKNTINKIYLNKKNEIYGILINIKNTIIYINIPNSRLENKSILEILNNKLYTYESFNNKNYNLKLEDAFNFIQNYNKFLYNLNKLEYNVEYYKLYKNELIIQNTIDLMQTNNFLLDDLILINKSKLQYILENNKINWDNIYDYLYINTFNIHNNNIISIEVNGYNLYLNTGLKIDKNINIIINKINEYLGNINKIIKSKNIDNKKIEYMQTRCIKLGHKNKYILPDNLMFNEKFNTILNSTLNNTLKNNLKLHLKHYFKIFLYNPIEISNILYNIGNSSNLVEYKDNRILKINDAIYNTNLYNLILLHLVNKINNIKNIKLRQKIKLLISNLDFTNIQLIITNSKFDKLENLIWESKDTNIHFNPNHTNKLLDNQLEYENKKFKIEIYDELISIIRNILINYNKVSNNIKNELNNISEIKNQILSIIDITQFKFDTIYIYSLFNLNKNEINTEINKLLKDSINLDDNLNTNLNTDLITIDLCDNIIKSYYCSKNKLIINKKDYNKLLDIISYDLTNKYKQTLLLNIINYNIHNIYTFKSFLNEEINIFIL
jgi:hypothetical protein